MTTGNLTKKTRAGHRCATLLISLLLAFLAAQCVPANSSRSAPNAVAMPSIDTTNKERIEAGPEDKTSGHEPLVILYEINPWISVIGSDSPIFVLYDNGLVIFARRAENRRVALFSSVLDERERDSLVSSLPVKQFFELEGRYSTTLMTDQPTTVIYLRDGGRLKSVSVYGGLKRTDNDRKEGAPNAFIETYEKIKGFDDARARPWMPEKIEMMLWPYENAGDALPWPKNWPDTKHPQTKKRGDDGSSVAYSIYLTRAQYETFKNRAASTDANSVLINGRKWAFDFRYPFPNEDSWKNRPREETK